MRSRRGPLDKALLRMITDNSAPRAMYALGPTIRTTTLSLTAYLHATVEESRANTRYCYCLGSWTRRAGVRVSWMGGSRHLEPLSATPKGLSDSWS